jgi:hypothetical protein
MISIKLVDKNIKINCTGNQLIDTKKIVKLYRTIIRLINVNGNIPIIVDIESNVRLSNRAKKIFTRLNTKCDGITLVIIYG